MAGEAGGQGLPIRRKGKPRWGKQIARAYRFEGRVSPGGARVLAGLIGKKARGRNGKPGTGKKLI